MNHPNSAIPESAKPSWWLRYENWQAKSHEKFLRRWGTRFPRLRNRRSARRLVITLILSWILVFVCSIAAFFTMWFVVPFLVLISLVFLPALYVLRAITLNVSDAPAAALDEIQLSTRNAARSLAFTVLWVGMFIPYLLLIAISRGSDTVDGQVIYGTGMLLIVLVVAATSIPICIVGWWLSDPDPEDYAVYDPPQYSQVPPHETTNATNTGGLDQ
ncbi:hypothetical protein [Williamsia sp. 1135]|uniref:hypothetical protein n=1 Tax=Williamsia sp. 1135 TaxID=1889262 RepID=UPI00197DBEC4|nr:hypothetical protein [Williamsia sp. 1135]